MPRPSFALPALLLALLLHAPTAAAQVVETPVAFDSAGRVMAITPTAAGPGW